MYDNSKPVNNRNFQQNDTSEIDLLDVFDHLRRKILFILAAAVLFAICSAIYTIQFIKPMYSTNAKIYIDSDYSEQSPTTSITLATNIAKDYPYIIKSNRVLDKVAENLGMSVNGSQLAGCVDVSFPDIEENLRVLIISVRYTSPQGAADIANEVVNVSAELLPSFAEYSRVKISVIDKAPVPSEPSSPNLIRNVILAAIIGAVLASTVFIAVYLLNDKIKTDMDVEKYLGLNVLGVIPDFSENKSKKKLSHVVKKTQKGKDTAHERDNSEHQTCL